MSDPSDPTIKAIDDVFDRADKVVDAFSRILHRGQQTDEKLTRHSKKRREIIDADVKESKKSSSSTAVVAKRPHFHIVEAVDPKGNTLYVVTDGGNARTECTTREFAAKILAALEKGQ